jgi:hypothetical protein
LFHYKILWCVDVWVVLANISIWEKTNKCAFEGGEKTKIKAFFEKMGDVT